MGSVMNVKIELPQHYIETEGSLVQRSLRSLKDGDAFAVFDEYGDIGVIGTGPWGDSSRRTVFDRRRQYLAFSSRASLLTTPTFSPCRTLCRAMSSIISG